MDLSLKQESPIEQAESSGSEFEPELGRKRKSKSPGIVQDKRKENDDHDHEDIAKQFKRFKAAAKYNALSEEVYCTCRKPDHGGELMISCDGCEEWFHFKCMRINQRHKELLNKFFCKFCQWKGVGMTLWNRKCRMTGCLKPIRAEQKLKYCSEECGLRFLRNALAGSSALKQTEIKFVITYSAHHEDFMKLGQDFPELPEVLQMDMKSLPGHIRDELVINAEQCERITAELKLSQLRSEYLLRVKEKTKLINDELQNTSDPAEEAARKGKKKKSKSAKIDICCFDERLNDELTEEEYNVVLDAPDAYTAFKSEIKDIIAAYKLLDPEEPKSYGKICLQDRRKCLKHNGWWNLVSDQNWKSLNELLTLLEQLGQEKADALREYSILVYENAASVKIEKRKTEDLAGEIKEEPKELAESSISTEAEVTVETSEA